MTARGSKAATGQFNPRAGQAYGTEPKGLGYAKYDAENVAGLFRPRLRMSGHSTPRAGKAHGTEP